MPIDQPAMPPPQEREDHREDPMEPTDDAVSAPVGAATLGVTDENADREEQPEAISVDDAGDDDREVGSDPPGPGPLLPLLPQF